MYYNDKKRSTKKFFKSKGMYIALFLCIAAVGAGTWGVVSNTVKIQDKETSSSAEKAEPATSAAAPIWDDKEVKVNKSVDNEADTRQETTQPSTVESNELNQPYESLYVMPAGNEILRDFSNGELVYSPTMDDWRTHNGIDFKAEKGTQVKAINDGVVLSVYQDEMWGTVIEIDHGSGLVAKYCGLDKEPNVKAGDSVSINSVIGAVDSIPCESADESHLHLETEIGSTLVDPLEAMGKTGQ